MKAIVHDRYGPPEEVLALRDVERPLARPREVLVRVHAASLHPDVWHVVTGLPYALRLMGAGLRRPTMRIPGTDVAGRVEEVGAEVTRFGPGDEVFGEVVRGHQWMNGGTLAEYVAVREDALERKPSRVSFAQAAAASTSGLIALRTLREEGRLQAGHRVLVNGAGGGVGNLAVQIAKASGAHVTGVDDATKRELVLSVGADEFVDYRVEDFTAGARRLDLVLDVASNLTLARCKRVLAPRGLYVLVGHSHFDEKRQRWLGSISPALALMARSPFDHHLPRVSFSTGNEHALGDVRDLMASGALVPSVDRTFPLGEIHEAMRYLKEGRAQGRIVITPNP